ncbi:dCTP deaminase [bacterium]|nr:dCTP deaminase [bacterium]
MILSDRDIKKYIREGKIKIKPKPNFEQQLGPCSLDLHLGAVFKVFKHTEHPYIDLKNPKVPIEKMMRTIKVSLKKPLILRPRDFVIAVTKEEIVLPDDIMGRLDGRSSLGRLGLVVHSTAARFDPGWKGKAIMEIGNLGVIPLALYPGIRICAMTFETLSSPAEIPYLKQKDHKYAGQKTAKASCIHKESY